MNCVRCHGTGLIMSHDPGIVGYEEYKDCPDCGGVCEWSIEYEKFDKSIHGEYYLKNPLPIKKVEKKTRRIIL